MMRRLVAALVAVSCLTGAPAFAQTPEAIDHPQKRFIAAVQAAKDAYAAGANEMAKGAARPERGKAICRVLKRKVAQEWTGEVKTLTTNSEGRGVLGIEIAEDITLTTWNNAISDVADKTMIDPDAMVYQQAMRLKRGQKVRLWGAFVPDPTDCVRESSVTLRGSIKSPEFLFRFSKIEPMD